RSRRLVLSNSRLALHHSRPTQTPPSHHCIQTTTLLTFPLTPSLKRLATCFLIASRLITPSSTITSTTSDSYLVSRQRSRRGNRSGRQRMLPGQQQNSLRCLKMNGLVCSSFLRNPAG